MGIEDVLFFIANELIGNFVVFYGIFVLIGNILRRSSLGDLFASTLKAIAGGVIFQMGINSLVATVAPVSGFMSLALGGAEGVVPNVFPCFANTMFHYGAYVGMATVLAVITNLILARFTKLHVIHITGHLILIYTGAFVGTSIGNGVEPFTAALLSGIVSGIYLWGLASGSHLLMRKNDRLTDKFGIGGAEIGFSAVTVFLSKIVGKREESTEEIKFPKSLSFLRDPMIGAGALFGAIMIIFGLMAGESAVTPFTGGQNWIIFLLVNGATYAATFWVLLYGIRMLIGELLPSFEGLQRLIPGAIPGLDYPLSIQFAPVGAFLGSMLFMAGQILATLVQIALGFDMIILPSACSGWFQGLVFGMYANAYGGRRAVFILVPLLGFVASFGWWLIHPLSGWLHTSSGCVWDGTDALFYLPWLLLSRFLGGGA